jgi:hypothetical protein
MLAIMGGAVAGIGVAIGVWGQGAPATTSTMRAAASTSMPASHAATTTAGADAKVVLGMPMQEVDMTAAPIGKVVEWVTMAYPVTLEIDWASLKAAGFDAETPLTFRLYDTTMEEMLKVLAAKVAESKPDVVVKYRLENNVVTIYAVKAAATAK